MLSKIEQPKTSHNLNVVNDLLIKPFVSLELRKVIAITPPGSLSEQLTLSLINRYRDRDRI